MKKVIFIMLIVCFESTFAQKKDENIGTEVVNVVKSYTPTISDANKLKEIPKLDDQETTKKETVKYEIFSFPVASTFTPSKGKAEGVDKAKRERLFTNYARLGFGSFASADGELFVSHSLDKYQLLSAKLNHVSAQNSIKNTFVNNKYAESSVAAFYQYQKDKIKWLSDAQFKTESYNWYGLPTNQIIFGASSLATLNPTHNYNTVKLASQLAISDSFFNNLNLQFISFTDSYKSSENRFLIQPNFNLNFDDININAKVGVDYLNTSFASSFLTNVSQVGSNTEIKISNLIVNINPNFQLLKDDLSADIGVDIVLYSKGQDIFAGNNLGSKSKFFVYPKINASYKLVNNIMVAFGGAEGKLIQNSYADFANSNKFLSPTLNVSPTDQQYDVFGGLRGKLSNIVNYNIKASYNASKNKVLFKSNPYLSLPLDNYSYGNSFTVVYDNVITASISGQINADINKNISLSLQSQYNSYSTQFEARAWNLPIFTATCSGNFTINSKWNFGTQLFYVGERKDEFTAQPFAINTNTIQTLDSYFDINLTINYKYNNRLSAFLKGNNLANQNYNRWLNYPVFGAQVILGANYNFDF